jgi:hypothetical protein
MEALIVKQMYDTYDIKVWIGMVNVVKYMAVTVNGNEPF